MYLVWQCNNVEKVYNLQEPKIRKKINKHVGYSMRKIGLDDNKFKGTYRLADAMLAVYYHIGETSEFQRFEIVSDYNKGI